MSVSTTLLAAPFAALVLTNVWMFWHAHTELSKSGESFRNQFPRRRSQRAWIKAYLRLAKSRGWPTWPAYLSTVAGVLSCVSLVIFLAQRL